MAKRENKRSIAFYVILIAILIIIIIAVGIAAFSGERNSSDKKTFAEQSLYNEEVIAIDTKYGNLYYPVKWEEKVIVKVFDETVYKVSFYGRIDEKEKQHLFDVAFGGEKGVLIGELEFDGIKVPVHIIGTEIERKNSWQDEEVTSLCEMQEDVNCIITMLKKEDYFTSID